MTTRRKLVVALGLSVLPVTRGSLAQPPPKTTRIGFLAFRSRSTPSSPDVYYDAFVQGMRELGYVEGKNLAIEWRFADSKSDRLPALASELVALKVDVIVTHATLPALTAQRATRTIPIVSAAMADPVASGLAASLARPGSNVTGLSVMAADVSPKQVELLRLIIPKLSRIAFLMNPVTPIHPEILKSVQTAAKTIGVTVLPVEAQSPEEIERGFATMVRERAGGLIVPADPIFVARRREIAELALKNKLPTMWSFREDVVAGGLMSYGQNLPDFYRRAATYVDKILKGTKPGELPIEQPMRIHLTLNRKTAKALGLAIRREMLLRADEVIE